MLNLTLGRVLPIVAISVTLVSQATWAADVVIQLDAGDGPPRGLIPPLSPGGQNW